MIYNRLLGIEEPKIPIHQFFAVMQEYALGNMTAQQATSAFNLSAGEQAEAITLLNKILAENGSDKRRLKALEFEQVLVIAEKGIAPYTTVDAVKTRLGV